MKLNPKEARMLRRLRRQRDQWSVTRWIMLGCGIVGLGWYWLLIRALELTESGALGLDVLNFLWPVVLIMMILSGTCAALAVGRWNGNPQTVLLLKLIDVVEQREGEESGPQS